MTDWTKEERLEYFKKTSCKNKVKYKNVKQASTVVNNARQKGKLNLWWYKCKICRKYHLTSQEQ